jgi:hypothetical protein
VRFAGPIRLGFPYQTFAMDVWADYTGEFDDGGIRDAYAKALRDEIAPLITSGTIETNARFPLEDGGPGVEFDLVEVFVRAVEAYAAFRVLGADIHRVLDRFKMLGDGRVVVDEAAASLLATEAVATEESFADIEILATETLRTGDVMDDDRGFIVTLRVNGAEQKVVVGPDGTIVGGTGPQLAVEPTGQVRPIPRRDNFDPPVGANPNGNWELDDEPKWRWTEWDDVEGEPEVEITQEEAKRRIAELEADPEWGKPRPPKRQRPKGFYRRDK